MLVAPDLPRFQFDHDGPLVPWLEIATCVEPALPPKMIHEFHFHMRLAAGADAHGPGLAHGEIAERVGASSNVDNHAGERRRSAVHDSDVDPSRADAECDRDAREG